MEQEVRQLDAPLGSGTRACGCRGCGRVFTGLTTFDAHQRMNHEGEGVLCLNPESLGMEKKASGRWGYPSDGTWTDRFREEESK